MTAWLVEIEGISHELARACFIPKISMYLGMSDGLYPCN